MVIGQIILLPKDTSLTAFGVTDKISKGIHIPLSKYKVLGIFWEEVFYPYPHSTKRILLKKGAGITYNKYAETVNNILSSLK